MENSCSKIIDIANTTRCRVVEFEYGEVLSVQSACPCCATDLIALCILVDDKGLTKIRIGACAECGYIGFVDRPSREKIAQFYNVEWDQVAIKSPEEIRNNFSLIESGYKASRYNVLKSILEIGLPPSANICEIGSGYGEVLRHLQLKGYGHLFGIEHSQHRAKNVSEAFGVNILWGEFEGSKVQEVLKKNRPFQLIYSNHVLEHTYNPNDIVRCASQLQEDGGYLILSVPKTSGENINGILHFIPHLHSFSPESLEALLNRNGYEVEKDCSFDDFNLILLAKKKSAGIIRQKIPRSGKYLETYLSRIQKGSVLQVASSSGKQELFWGQAGANADHSVVSEAKWWLPKKAFRFVRSRYLKKFSNGEFFLFEGNVPRKTDRKLYPFEIQFDGPIKALLK